MNTGDAVQQLLDLEAIKTLKHRYIRCMTQSRWDELETLLAPTCKPRIRTANTCSPIARP